MTRVPASPRQPPASATPGQLRHIEDAGAYLLAMIDDVPDLAAKATKPLDVGSFYACIDRLPGTGTSG
jgi:hypothetical protein